MLRIRYSICSNISVSQGRMPFRASTAVIFLALIASTLSLGQARSLITNAPHAINLPSTPGQRVILGSVLLGQPRSFAMFNIQATGTITPDPNLNGAAFQLEFLVCDQPDCSGDLHWPMRVLPEADAIGGAQVLATRSFGVSTHNVNPVVLTDLKPQPATGVLFLAVALRVLHSPSNTPFAAKLNLLRVDVLP
jgi:hypothetical protein